MVKETEVTRQEFTSLVCNHMDWQENTSHSYGQTVVSYSDSEFRIKAQVVKKREGNTYYVWK